MHFQILHISKNYKTLTLELFILAYFFWHIELPILEVVLIGLLYTVYSLYIQYTVCFQMLVSFLDYSSHSYSYHTPLPFYCIIDHTIQAEKGIWGVVW